MVLAMVVVTLLVLVLVLAFYHWYWIGVDLVCIGLEPKNGLLNHCKPADCCRLLIDLAVGTAAKTKKNNCAGSCNLG